METVRTIKQLINLLFTKRVLFLFVFFNIVTLSTYSVLSRFILSTQDQTQEVAEYFYKNEQNIVAKLETLPQNVLGDSSGDLSFHNGGGVYSDGGVISLSTSEDKVINLTSSRVSGSTSFALYQLGKEDLINYLLYTVEEDESWGKTLRKTYSINTDLLTPVAEFQQEIVDSVSQYKKNTIEVPFNKETGIWLLTADKGDVHAETLLVRSNINGVVNEGDNELVFWVQNQQFEKVPAVQIEVFNTRDFLKPLGTLVTDQDGIAKVPIRKDHDFAVLSKDGDISIIPINLKNLRHQDNYSNYYYNNFFPRETTDTSYLFTDRFLYKPGDTVYFKSVIRTEDDVQFSIEPRTVFVSAGTYNQTFVEKIMSIDETGSVSGSFTIPEDSEDNYYTIYVKDGEEVISSGGVQVAQFRKPSTQVTVSTKEIRYLPGETLRGKITATQFLGQPVKNREVRYKIYQRAAGLRGPHGELVYATSSQYYGTDQGQVAEGTLVLDENGVAEFEIPVVNTTGYRQFWTMQVEYVDESGSATNDNSIMLIEPGNFVINTDAVYKSEIIKDRNTDVLVQLYKNIPSAKINSVTLNAVLSYRKDSGEYIIEKDDLAVQTDDQGQARFSISPKLGKKQYKLELNAQDLAGNTIRLIDSFYVPTSRTDGASVLDFEITTDKQIYDPGETAIVTIKTSEAIKDVLVAEGRSFFRSYRVLHLEKGVGFYRLPILTSHQPNIFIYTGSFSQGNWHHVTKDIEVTTRDKKVELDITFDQETYAPGETAVVEITARDENGTPVQTDLAFWLMDKAILELHGGIYDGIFDQFWRKRYFHVSKSHSLVGFSNNESGGHGGGCFTGDTLISLADGSQKEIQHIQVGETVSTFASTQDKEKVSAKVLDVHEVTVDGYLVLNEQVHITPEHILYVNSEWIPAGDIQIGDTLINQNGRAVEVETLEWIKGETTVYNLHVETYNTFFANSIYVHNEKGDGRSVFKDTAYWNPHVTTGVDGKARLVVPLPDNLTTWVGMGVAANAQTQVGFGSEEFIVTKDIVVRPILPKFLRDGDTVNLSTLLFNFTENDELFKVTAEFTAGALDVVEQTVSVATDSLETLFWATNVVSDQPKQTAELSVSIEDEAGELRDGITESIPIFEYGSWQERAQKGVGVSSIPFTFSSGTDVDRAGVSIILHSERYPEFSEKIRDVLSNKYSNVTEMLVSGTIMSKHSTSFVSPVSKAEISEKMNDKLESLKKNIVEEKSWRRNRSGNLRSNILLHIEPLIIARDQGFNISQDIIDELVTITSEYLTPFNSNNEQSYDNIAIQQYIFSLSDNTDLKRRKAPVAANMTPAGISQALMANKRQGFGVTQADIDVLLNAAIRFDNQVVWRSQLEENYIYNIEDQTFWAVRALLEVGGEMATIESALDYIARNHSAQGLDSNALLAISQYYEKAGYYEPNARYSVLLNENTLASGQIKYLDQKINPIEVGADSLTVDSVFSMFHEGAGVLHHTLTTKQFFTDRTQPKEGNHLSLQREYLYGGSKQKPLEAGDLVVVSLIVEGLGIGEANLQVVDYLPSGLVAVDEKLDNGNFDLVRDNTPWTQQRLTDQGIVLTKANYFDGSRAVFNYKTRVVSEGVFDTPPATVVHQGDPTLWALSNAQQFVADSSNTLELLHKEGVKNIQAPLSSGDKVKSNSMIEVLTVVLLGGLGLGLYKWRQYRKKKQLNHPNTPENFPDSREI